MVHRLWLTYRPIPPDTHTRAVLLQLAPFVAASAILTLAVLAAGLVLPGVKPLSAAEGTTCRVIEIEPIAPVVGEGHLCRDADGVQARISASNLSPGTAYTGWFVYFDRPVACVALPCGMRDMIGVDPQGVAARIASIIAPNDGRGVLSTDFHGVRLSRGSQVSLLLARLGPPSELNNRTGARQLLITGPYWLQAAPGGPVTDDETGVVVASAVFGDE
jgi:hypothetical protein